MDDIRKKQKIFTYLEINKIMMQESGQENTIFTEVQTGPQEEPILREDYLDVNQFKKFKLNNSKRKSSKQLIKKEKENN